MEKKPHKPALFYTPRILSLVLILILGSFAVQAYQEAEAVIKESSPFTIYLLSVFILLLVTGISWKKARIGGTLFIIAGLFYVFQTNELSASSLAMVATPLILLGLLFHISQYYYEK